MEIILLLLLVFPLFGAAFNATFGLRVPRRLVEIVACASIVAAFVMAVIGIISLGERSVTVTFFQWLKAGSFSASMDAWYNPLAAVMALMVTFVSSIIHIYSAMFMRDDEDYARYFCYLNLFVFSMLVITLADNLVFLFLGWEGVGFCSYGLVAFWYTDEVKATAGQKAFIVTRIGDVAFGAAIGFFFVIFTNLSISYIDAHAVGQLSTGMATVLGLLLLASAAGKSAQLPLTVWLPDAMAGPTPVSALIHAATMVTAGVYLLMRLFPAIMISSTAVLVIDIVATFTAFYAACSALVQHDIKRVLAYSTISQVGYMMMGVGAGDIIGGLYHLFSHAFFKSLLFLAAGCVIQALHEDHNIFHMGKRVRRHLPGVYLLFLAGAISLGALPGSAGYFSKDRVLLANFVHPGTIYKVLWAVGTFGAFLTTVYTFRMFFLAFTGEPAEKPDHEPKQIPRWMSIVQWPLAILALFAGFINFPQIWGGGAWLAQYLSVVPGAMPHLPALPGVEWEISVFDMIVATAGLLVAFLLYGPKDFVGMRKPVALGQLLHDFLFAGFYLDKVYSALLVRPYQYLARIFWLYIDEGGFDNLVVGFGKMFGFFSTGARLWTTGRLSTYLSMLFLGFTLILCVLALTIY